MYLYSDQNPKWHVVFIMNCYPGLAKELFVYHLLIPRGNCNNITP